MRDVVLIGAEDVSRAAATMQTAAQDMIRAANQIELAFQQRRQWEEEYLQRLETLVEKEIAFFDQQAPEGR